MDWCLFRPYTPMNGALSHVWFDRHKISRDCPEHSESIEEMCGNLGAVIQDEIRAGVPKHRMVIGTSPVLLSLLVPRLIFLLTKCLLTLILHSI